ncbi:MAG: hypothetical protein KKH93_06415 [Candidatus Omnitrophica bacterium]|nr:hypothetical protein [Candidatus Omnitrophota bacterium]MBU2044942.1 hypothetical protein [Candidatus Omnitrophota bacterium]MBU2265907.1 hypothetical protein [Candidatus Omnitrophota bacterium]MBU2473532.1 hypothetical protein [Candidatus Omnitrophota bacterium]
MPKKKLTPELKRAILKAKKKFSGSGVRELAVILADQYKINLSKSLIHKVLKEKGLKEKPGRKNQSEAFQARKVESCGLMLLRALDSQVGLFDYLTEKLKVYFKDFNPEQLKKIITLASLSFFIDKKLKISLSREGFLRLVGLRQISGKSVDYFNQVLLAKRPVVSLEGLKNQLRPASAVRFIFKNGSQGFSDGRLATFWDKPQKSEAFSSSLRVLRQRFKKMLENKVLIIGYTKSFNYLSATAFNFIRGLKSGLTAVELLGPAGEVLDRLKVTNPLVYLVFGYSPQLFMPPVVSQKPQRFKRFLHGELGELFLTTSPAAFRLTQEGITINLNNFRIKSSLNSSVFWGVLGFFPSGDKKFIPASLNRYFYWWPYIYDDFFKETELVQGKGSSKPAKPDLSKMLPQKVVFTQTIDFIRVGQILSILFKETVQGWEPKGKTGNFSLCKDCLRITLKQAPRALKKAFNQAAFELEGRPVFLQ